MKFQDIVYAWAVACFGRKDADDKQMRSHRFIEEALELVQACGTPKSEVLRVIEYVYGRPAGTVDQEIGGTMVTLATLSMAQGYHMDECADMEILRCIYKIDQIRVRHAAKPKFGDNNDVA